MYKDQLNDENKKIEENNRREKFEYIKMSEMRKINK